MLPSLRTRCVLAAGVLAFAAACAPQPKVEEGIEAHGFAAADLKEGRTAVGGVVLAAGVALEGPGNPDGDEWASLLYGQFIAQDPPIRVLPLPMVSDLVGEDLLRNLQRDYAEQEHVSPALLAEFRQRVPQADHLVLVRVEKDEIIYRTPDVQGDVVDDRATRPSDLVRPAGRPFPPTARRARRAVTAAMVIIDLSRGATVWSARVERRREIIVEHYSAAKAGDLKVTPSEVEGETPVIETPAPDLQGLEIEGVLADCLEALVGNLVAAYPAAGGETERATGDG